MKLKRLLSLAVLCIVGMTSAWAQTQWEDVTSTYLSNANLASGSGTNWEKTGNWTDGCGTAYGELHVSENYSGWESQEQTDFKLTQNVTLPSGFYKIEAYALYGGTFGTARIIAKNGTTVLGSTNIVKQGTLDSSDQGTSGGPDLKKAANTFNGTNYLNVTYFVLTEQTTVTIGVEGTHTAYRQWFCAGPMKLYKTDALKASEAEPIDLTSLIYNPNIYNKTNTEVPAGWTVWERTANNNNRTTSTGDTQIENWHPTPADARFDYYQKLSNLPQGYYVLTADVIYRNGKADEAGVYAYTNNPEKQNLAAATVFDGTMNSTSAEFYTSGASDSYVNVGVKRFNTMSGDWFAADNFTLSYLGNGVEHYATDIPDGNTTANNWYVIPITVAGEYRVTSTAGGTIYYTQDGTQAPSEVTNTTTSGSTLDLQVGNIYLKTSVATTITIEADIKEYVVGNAVADKTYIQPGQTVTVTFVDATTNDKDATFGTNGAPRIEFGSEAIQFTPVEKGFSFTVPEGITAGQDYNLTILANGFGYAAGEKFNEKQTITLKTPVIFDGTYFIKDQDNRYISRGADSNTEAALDAFGIAFNVSTDTNNKTTLTCVDSKAKVAENAEHKIYTNGNPSNANHKMIFVLQNLGDNKVAIETEWGNHIVVSSDVAAATNGSYGWTFEPASEHAAVMTALKNAQASAAATSAGLTASTPAELEAAIESAGLTEAPVTVGVLTPATEYFKSAGTSKNTVTISVAGIYKMTISGYTRAAGYNDAYAQYAAGNENVVNYVYLGENKTQMASLFSEGRNAGGTDLVQPTGATLWYPDRTGTGTAAFNDGMYKNVVWAYLTPGDYEYGVAVVSNPATDNWVWYSPNVTLVRYSTNIAPGDDMTGKITNPGFETGDMTGWTCATGNDTGSRDAANNTYKALGSEGSKLFNTWDNGNGGALTQNIGALPAGIYTLTAMLAAEADVCLTLNEETVVVTPRQNNKKVMHKASITFVSDGATEYTIGAKGNTGNWYKADAFKLTYVNENTAENLYNIFEEVYDASAPWTSDAYATTRSGYASYSASTSQEELLAAINYMNSKYDDYAWDNASAEHPYLMPNYVFGFDNSCKTNDGTDGPGYSSGRTLTEDTRPDGSTGPVWSANGGGSTRSGSMTLPYQGIYKLQAKVKKVVDEAHHVDITIDGETTVNNDLTKDVWTDMDINLGNTDYKECNVKVFISNTNGRNDYVRVGGIDLYYTGLQGDFVKGETHYYFGNYATVEATDEVPVVDATLATGVTTFTRTNPNGLCYAASDATLTGDNVVKGNTCATLVLTDGHPFKATKNFEATSASYNMTAIAGDKFGTLMIPFAASTMPDGNKVYVLDQGVSFGEEIHATEANAITANKPVLVTKAGTYSASNVAVAATNDTYTNGELVGTYKAMKAPANSYVLQKHDSRVAFFLVKDVQPTVNPFRAYIKAQSAGARQFLNIMFDDATAIEGIESDSQQSGAIYDLSGRKVSKTQKGIYIINGKKVMK